MIEAIILTNIVPGNEEVKLAQKVIETVNKVDPLLIPTLMASYISTITNDPSNSGSPSSNRETAGQMFALMIFMEADKIILRESSRRPV